MYQAYQATAQRDTSIDASDDFTEMDASRYCPTELLGRFALLMAGHGRSVSADMMLGDREYAMWQLASAHALGDGELRTVAARLFSYFEDPRGWSTVLHA